MRTLVLIGLALCGCATQPAPAPSLKSGEQQALRPIVIGESRTIASKALGEERTLNVYLPPSYAASGAKYPVVWLIDGGVAQDFPHIAGLAQYGALSGMFREAIIVGVETRDRQRELTSPAGDPQYRTEFPTHGGAAAFRAFIAEEAMPLIASHYRTSGEDVALGESLAGLFIVESFLKQPGLFDSAVAISPSLWWDAGALAKGASADLQRFDSAERKIYLAVANEGGEMDAAMRALVDTIRKAKRPGLAWSFADRKDLTHATIYHREALEALATVLAAPTAASR
jgi:hypothetical protein